MKFDKERIFSLGITLFLVVLLVFSGPTSALQISIHTDKPVYDKNEMATISVDTEIETGERLPIDSVILTVSGPGKTFSCELPFDSIYSNSLVNCSGEMLNVSLDLGHGFGYGYGYLNADYDEIYEWGYGYGYGYGQSSTSMNYTIYWTVPSDLESGEYTAEITFNTYEDQLVSSTTFNVNPDSTTTVTSTGGGSNNMRWIPLTSTTMEEYDCGFECKAVCEDDLEGSNCYERNVRGECSGGTICCESVEIKCPSLSGEEEETTTTIPKEKGRNPLTGLLALIRSPSLLWILIFGLFMGLGILYIKLIGFKKKVAVMFSEESKLSS